MSALSRKPLIKACRSVEDFECLSIIEEGTYGVVYKGRDRQTSEIVALKWLKLEKEHEGFPITALREINALHRCAPHPHIVQIKEIVTGNSSTEQNDEFCVSSVLIVMEYVEHDLRSLMERMQQPFALSEIKTLLKQLLEALDFLHSQWLVHRDIKASNLLLSNSGMLKVADFGLARKIPFESTLLSQSLTPMVVTLWYRAPEILLGAQFYDWAVDMWSAGCMMAELLLGGNPLFQGEGEIAQLGAIMDLLGDQRLSWPGFESLPLASKINCPTHRSKLNMKFPELSKAGFVLLQGLLTYDPQKRLSASKALRSQWFAEEPLPKPPSAFPSWPNKQPR